MNDVPQASYETPAHPPPAATPPEAESSEPSRLAPSDTGVSGNRRPVPERVLRGQRKSPFLACVLSLMPGVGQVYVGYYKLGFIHNVVFAGTVMVLSLEIEALVPLFGIFLAFFFVYNVVDAGRRAALYNLALDGVEGLPLPDDLDVKIPDFGGSVGGGLFLIVFGVILLSNTLFDIPLDWVEEWWPVAPILLGAYLVTRALRDGRETTGDLVAGEHE